MGGENIVRDALRNEDEGTYNSLFMHFSYTQAFVANLWLVYAMAIVIMLFQSFQR